MKRHEGINRRRFLAYGATTTAIGMAGCLGGGGGNGDGDGATDTDEGDGGDGDGDSQKLVQYGPVPEDVNKPFSEEYGVEVEAITGPGAQTIARFLNEESSDNHVADVISNVTQEFGNPDLQEQLREVSDLPADNSSVRDNAVEEIRSSIGEEALNHMFALNANEYTVVYNTDNVDGPPEQPEDLLASEYENSIIMPAYVPDTVLGFLTEQWGAEQAEQYMVDLDAQGVKYQASSMIAMVDRVIAGEYDVAAFVFAGPGAADRLVQDAPIDVAYFDPTMQSIQGVGVSKDAPHMAAAEDYVSYGMSLEGQKAVQATGGGRLVTHGELGHGNDHLQELRSQVERIPVVFTADETDTYKKRIEELIDIGGG